MEESKKIKNKKIMIIILSTILLLLVIGFTFAYFTNIISTDKQNIAVGHFSIDYKDVSSVNLENLVPIKEEEIKEKAAKIEFSVTNDGDYDGFLRLDLVDINMTANLGTRDTYWALYQGDTEISKGNFGCDIELINEKQTILRQESFSKGATNTYQLYIYILENQKDQSSTLNGTLSAKIEASATDISIEQTYESVPLGTCPNEPDLMDGTLLAVTYDEENSTWVKADTNDEWYNYTKQQWANAVTVSESTRSTYQSASVGTTISMDDIETMWVWIPRYEYSIQGNYSTSEWNWNVSSYEEYDSIPVELPEIHINFVSTLSKTEGDYYTHPAFTFGDTELSGIWVAKFETGGTTSKPLVKPNITSLRNQNVSTFFNMSRTLSSEGNSYGISTTADSHMMKNTEWGAVAYLSQSIYGKYGNNNYKGFNKKVAVNNCSSYITGIGGDTVDSYLSSNSCTNPINMYNGEKGVMASTTGNIYGIYDMTGGAWEYVMGNYDNYSGNTITYHYITGGHSGFNGKLGSISDIITNGQDFPESKYYDLYTSDNVDKGHVKGDATYETRGWFNYGAYYNSGNWFVDKYNPWFTRGGFYKSSSVFSGYNNSISIFTYGHKTGDKYDEITTRMVIARQ